jgi:MFS family permease
MILDISPLKKYPQFRLLFLGQLVSTLGSNISYVAAPYFIYVLTHSTAKVGLLGGISLVPLVLCGFWGGAVADVANRRKVILICEAVLTVLCCAFAYLVQTGRIQEIDVYVLVAVMSALAGFHRPALESLTPRLVQKEDMPKVSSLQGFRGTFAHILGPAIGGLLIAKGGVAFAFWIDAATYVFSMGCLLGIRNPLRDEPPKHRPGLRAIREGFMYAVERPVLLGTYVVDMIAMTFCYPVALFPAIADQAGGPDRLGPLYSAISAGALIASLTSAWTYRVRRHGAWVTRGAALWCLSVIGFALCFQQNYWLGFAWLAAAGFADMISVMFRFTIWNETIPDSHRGRLAGIEMISYMTGPLLGNTMLGYIASVTSIRTALLSGASLALLSLGVAGFLLKPFWTYMAEPRTEKI